MRSGQYGVIAQEWAYQKPAQEWAYQKPAQSVSAMNELTVQHGADMAVAGFRSPHTRRAYAARIEAFARSGQPLTREGVRLWIQSMRPATSSKINQAIKAVKVLVQEARARGILSEQEARAIVDLRYDRALGVRQGNWLTLEQARRLYEAPDRSTLRGKRDAALLALLMLCLLRRSEACEVTWGHYQEREGRMVLLDVVGKGGSIRTVPVCDQAREDIDAWEREMQARGLAGDREPILRGMPQPFDYEDIFRSLGASGAHKIVVGYAHRLGWEFAPHDLRRTSARLMRESGESLEQIQLTLGHSSVATTERYLGGALKLKPGEAGVDKIRWKGGD